MVNKPRALKLADHTNEIQAVNIMRYRGKNHSARCVCGTPAVDFLNGEEHLGRLVLGSEPTTAWEGGRITRLGLPVELQAAAPERLTQVQGEDDILFQQVLTQC